MEENIKSNIFRSVNMDLTEEDILMLNPLQLAYIGDGVYELFIRSYLINGELSVNSMNKIARNLVSAEAQSLILELISKKLIEEELRIVKRGRNAKTSSVPKNGNIRDYRYATGFECLIGYLYLRREDFRLKEIMEIILYSKLRLSVELELDNLTSNIDLFKDHLFSNDFFSNKDIKFIGNSLNHPLDLNFNITTSIERFVKDRTKLSKLIHKSSVEFQVKLKDSINLRFEEDTYENQTNQIYT